MSATGSSSQRRSTHLCLHVVAQCTQCPHFYAPTVPYALSQARAVCLAEQARTVMFARVGEAEDNTLTCDERVQWGRSGTCGHRRMTVM